MNAIGLIVAIFLPAFMGFAWLHLLWNNSHWTARVGYGYMLGVFILTSILQLWGEAGLPLNFFVINALMLSLTILPVGWAVYLRSNFRYEIGYSTFNATWQKVMWLLLLAVLAIRFGQILQEIILRPLYPWDAWMNWAPKAKTWFALEEIVPFVSPYLWATHEFSANVYTLGNPDAWRYPPLVPLLQMWTAIGMGHWVDNLVNIPWAMCLMALGFSFYGQGRMLGIKPHVVLLAVCLLFSLPFVATHAALAGYADIWLACYFGLAGMAFINWSQTGDYRQAILLIIFAIACTQTKIPGLAWAAIFIPASLFVFLPKRWGYLLIIAVLGGWWIFQFGKMSINIGDLILTPTYISIPSIGSYSIEFHNVSKEFYINGLLWGSWNVFWWLLIVVVPVFFVLTIRYENLLAPNALVALALFLIYVIFFYTKHYLAAIDGTTINRAIFHIVPLLLYYVMYVIILVGRRLEE